MGNDEFDRELEEIREKRLREMMERGERSNYPAEPIEVTDATLDETVQKYPLVVVDCWAPWCGPCHVIAPVIEELARDYRGKVVFGKLNVDENADTAMKYNIMSIPSLLIFSNGELVDQRVGAMPREMLEPIITQYLR